MAFLQMKYTRIAGISSAVPTQIERISDLPIFSAEEAQKFSDSTGVVSRHVSDKLLSSDLCVAAAEKLLADLGWEKASVDALVVVTQTPDYHRPSNGPLIQDRLGLSRECASLCISFGCSGWVYGMSTAAGMINSGCKRVLLCCGEGIQAYNKNDKSTYPLFGSVGTCTALEFDESAAPIEFHLASDGFGWQAINIPDGGYRNPPTASSARLEEFDGGIKRTRLNVALNGMDVFSFGISRPPKSIKALSEHFNRPLDGIDYLLLHQANMMLNAKIAKKVGVPEEKAPHNIEEFGNSSSATLPLLMVTRLKTELEARPLKCVGCAFGVGLSWGSIYFETDKPVVSDLVLVEEP